MSVKVEETDGKKVFYIDIDDVDDLDKSLAYLRDLMEKIAKNRSKKKNKED